MKITRKGVAAAIGATLAVSVLAGCSSAADTTSYNLSQAAENFEVMRKISFINGISDKILLEVEGYCSVESADSFLAGSVEVTCKIGPDKYLKHFLGLSDNTTYLVEQIQATDNLDEWHYRWVIRPETLIPDIDVLGSGGSPLPDPDGN